jgi:hypothetical protein
MNGALVFRQLVVRRMPGFPGGGPRLSDLSPGINLVHGPNASGKTTAAVAIQSLLWPPAAPGTAGLEGRFELDGAGWRVDVESRRPSWQRDGQESSPPPLPPADDRDRYFLSLHGLLSADDRDLAERIRVESAGGYDVRAAAEALRFGAGGRPRTLVDGLAAAREILGHAREREAELRDEAARLERMREDQRALARTARRLEPLRRALALARARDRAAEAERAVGAFPAAMARLRGDELERLDEWARAREAAERAIDKAEADAARAAAELEAVGLGEDGVAASLLVEVESRLEALRRLDDEMARARDARADARGRRQRAGGSLGMDADPESMSDPSAADADRLDRFVRRAEALRARRAGLEERIRMLTAGAGGAAPTSDSEAGGSDGASTGEAGSEAEAAARAVRVLRGWLRAGVDGRAAERRVRVLLLVAAAVLGATGLAGIVAGTMWPASPSVIAAGVLLAVASGILLILRPGPEPDGRPPLERQATRLGYAPPRWTADAVESLLDELEERIAAERIRAERRVEAERLEGELRELATEESALEAERVALATALGLAPATGDLTLHALATRLRDWEEARGEEAAADELLREVDRRRGTAIAAAAAALAPYGYAPADAAAVASALKDLRDRRERHHAAATALTAAGLDRSRAIGDQDDVGARRRELFAGLGLEPDADLTLRAWSGQLHAFREASSDLQLAERERAAASEALAEIAETPAPDLRSADGRAAAVAELERAVEDAEAAAAAERELAAIIAGIEARLEDARQKHDVEEALARVTAAKAELADRRGQDVEAEVGAALVDWLGERERDRNRPAVFHRARELFELITRGRYRLDMEDGDRIAFRAYDQTTHRGHSLDELSSGTRLQLLLAVRIAFVESQEVGAALPLLLDELLANSDDERAAAIIDAALALARDGRQIFYFTAQADELVKWMSRLETQHAVDWCVRGIQDGAAADGPAMDWPAQRPETPPPAGMDHSAYGRTLHVPPFDPWADGVGGVHLWYLVDDVEALHQLLAMGISRWGQLEALASAATDAALPGGILEAVVDEARAAAALCDRFRLLWRRGRGRPVDRAALAESGAISDTFMEPVATLCQEVDGQGQALIDALGERRVPRFQAAKTEELRAFLQAGGFLSDEEPLTPEQIRVRLSAQDGDASTTAVDALIERLVRGASLS